MEVIALDRVVTDPELTALAGLSQAGSELAQERPASERRNAASHTDGDVGWVATRNRRPFHVVNGRAGRSGLAAGAGAVSAVTAKLHGQLAEASTHTLIIAMFSDKSMH
jgi:predicted mannosyl-3-phosphoglycerate phosphatase (HAD superfamily)